MTEPQPRNHIQELQSAFTKARAQLLRISLVSLGITFLSLAVVGTKLFYPFHMVIGVGLYLLSWIPIAHRVYMGRKTWRTYHSYAFAERFFRKEKRRLVLGLLAMCLVAVFLYARPMDDRPFAHLSDEEVRILVQDDLYTAVTAMDYLESTGQYAS